MERANSNYHFKDLVFSSNHYVEKTTVFRILVIQIWKVSGDLFKYLLNQISKMLKWKKDWIIKSTIEIIPSTFFWSETKFYDSEYENHECVEDCKILY